jgi:predicted O-methyltransferase YrrM
VVDNVLWSGQVGDPAVHDPATNAIRRFNAFVHADERVRVALLPVADGLTLALKRPTG